MSSQQVSKKSKTELMDLPNEILENILGGVLVSERPIEFAPIHEVSHVTGFGVNGNERLGPCQYQKALDFQSKIRPALSVLRVCKRFYEAGTRAYYSENAFQFSNDLGWLVIARFFDLIGPKNVALLRDVTVIHPALSKSLHAGAGQWTLYVNFLSPFGMADMPGYDEVYKLGDVGTLPPWMRNKTREELEEFTFEPDLIPKENPLDTLHEIRGLKRLSFLSYSAECPAYGRKEYDEHIDYMITRLDTGTAKFFSKLRRPQLSVTFVNLVSHREGQRGSLRAWYSPVAHAAEPTFELGEPCSDQELAALVKSFGWSVQYEYYDPPTGVWPLQEPESVPNREKEYLPHCEDFSGWCRRDDLEKCMAQSEANNALCRLTRAKPPGLMLCARCGWRSDDIHNHLCESAITIPADWLARGFVLGNPGTRIEFDVTKFEGENFFFKKSHVVREIEKALEEDHGPLFNRFTYHKKCGGTVCSPHFREHGRTQTREDYIRDRRYEDYESRGLGDQLKECRCSLIEEAHFRYDCTPYKLW